MPSEPAPAEQKPFAYSDEDMPPERVRTAAEIAQASNFIESKTEGMESEVSQGGTNVSGGQRQRLAIARALATEARAYLFDDSFSALDYKTDATLRQELHTRLSDKTVVIVAHRLSTVKNADQIVVLNQGKVVEVGNHESLTAKRGAYYNLVKNQLELGN